MKEHKVESIVRYVELPCLSGYSECGSNDFSFSGNDLDEFEKTVVSYFRDALKEVREVIQQARDEAKSKGYIEPFIEFESASMSFYYDSADFSPAKLHIKAYRPMTDKEKAVKLKNSKAAKKARKEKADKEKAEDLAMLAKLKAKYEED